ncbi:uncharacterized protein CIMG_06039 [Coccidioides immitis RS]|uniref:Uncharacterized protein n=1 Tax=Coccidioides immitis (strain RS) TaxID=246410 RepID=J3K7A3_COCIM|nr:uncharacterized protein CIMG_06039 [Coccidioides immitis RS]EAS30560.3 hypothetical protein CIMG_06039 [Coccidioides immitis RS]
MESIRQAWGVSGKKPNRTSKGNEKSQRPSTPGSARPYSPSFPASLSPGRRGWGGGRVALTFEIRGLVGGGALACPAQMKQHPSRTSGAGANQQPMPPCARHIHITHIRSTSRYSMWVIQLRALANPQGTIRVRRDAEDRIFLH